MHHVPVERCAGILESMSGLRPSDGWVHALLDRAAKAVAAANKTIRALIILARVICGDETPVRVGPGPRPARSTCRSRAPACSPITSSVAGTWPRSRTSSTATCTARSSCTTGTSTTTGPRNSHQLCSQRLLRDLEDAAQAYPDVIWPGQIAGALRGLVHAANVARDGAGRRSRRDDAGT